MGSVGNDRRLVAHRGRRAAERAMRPMTRAVRPTRSIPRLGDITGPGQARLKGPRRSGRRSTGRADTRGALVQERDELDLSIPRKPEELGIPVALIHDLVLRQAL